MGVRDGQTDLAAKRHEILNIWAFHKHFPRRVVRSVRRKPYKRRGDSPQLARVVVWLKRWFFDGASRLVRQGEMQMKRIEAEQVREYCKD